MIDFRYHLVSIASVFLALAVGIVLGAGPLRGPISDTLTSEVTKLREDANALRAEVAAAENAVTARDEVITALRPRAVAGVLQTEPVSILVLPGADGALDDAQTVLTQADAPAATVARLDPSWSRQNPADEEARTSAAAELRDVIDIELPVDAAPDAVLNEVLDLALTTPVASDAGALPGETPTADPGTTEQTDQALDDALDAESVAAVERSRQILSVLASHGLVADDSSVSGAGATSVLVIAPETNDGGEAEIASWSALMTTLDGGGSVTVAGDLPADASAKTNLIAAVRGNDVLGAAVSTLDNVSTPLGGTALPFVIAEIVDGTVGSYGLADSAAAVFPSVPSGTP